MIYPLAIMVVGFGLIGLLARAAYRAWRAADRSYLTVRDSRGEPIGAVRGLDGERYRRPR